MAAAAAISSTKKRKKSFAFETNPSIRKRQQTRILRKLRQNIEEYSLRVGQQAVVLVATPGGGKSNQVNFRYIATYLFMLSPHFILYTLKMYKIMFSIGHLEQNH